jgi:hypothetical protein
VVGDTGIEPVTSAVWKDGGPNGEHPVLGHAGGVIITTHCTVGRLTKTQDTPLGSYRCCPYLG